MRTGGGMDASTKTPKTSSGQEQPSTSSSTSAYTDCASFQAYFNPSGTSPIPPAGFFHSPMGSSPQPHPYIWGAQQMVPPYGTPPPYVAMYSHGLYGHPSIAPGSHPYSPYMMPFSNGTAESSAGGGPELEGKQRSPIKSAKGSLGNLNTLTGKDNDAKASGTLGDGTPSQSCESGGEGPSTEGSDADSENGSQKAPNRKQEALSVVRICLRPNFRRVFRRHPFSGEYSGSTRTQLFFSVAESRTRIRTCTRSCTPHRGDLAQQLVLTLAWTIGMGLLCSCCSYSKQSSFCYEFGTNTSCPFYGTP